MTPKTPEWIWLDGDWVKWNDATVHVTTHSLHYGSAVFEGIRAYEGKAGTAVFRLPEHIRRLFNSCKIIRMDLSPHTVDSVVGLCIELVSRNRFPACYLRPVVFRGAGPLGVYPEKCPVRMTLMAVEWGRYLGQDALEAGVDVMVSSWRRGALGSFAPLAKIGGQYVTNQMVTAEARASGFAEGLMLDAQGQVAEGAGENLFMVSGGALITPPLAATILGGITRDSILTLAREMSIPVRSETLTRDMLYIADELFLTGTAAEITPIRSVDRIPIGCGKRGAMTQRLQEAFFAIITGTQPDRHGWLTPVPPART